MIFLMLKFKFSEKIVSEELGVDESNGNGTFSTDYNFIHISY